MFVLRRLPFILFRIREWLIIDVVPRVYEISRRGTRLHMFYPSRADEDYAFQAGSWRRAKVKVPGVISAIVSVRTKAWELISRRVYGWAP